MKRLTRYAVAGAVLHALLSPVLHAAAGTEGAAFLEIPVGAGPAALGGAYSALATDAFAATYNPAGLGRTEGAQFSGQHLSYLESAHYEHLGFAIPFGKSGAGVGGAVQYLGSGSLEGYDELGTATGDFSNHYAAYSLAVGHRISDYLSLGLTGKYIHAKMQDLTASAYAGDVGALFRAHRHVEIAATVQNIGSKIKFIDQADSLPLTVTVGAAYRPSALSVFTAEVVRPKSAAAIMRFGMQWRPLHLVALRGGYRTDNLKELSPLAGASLGIGLFAWGQEFSYAWLPYGDLGNTHYFSILVKLGNREEANRRLIQFGHPKRHAAQTPRDSVAPEDRQLMELLLSPGPTQLAEAAVEP